MGLLSWMVGLLLLVGVGRIVGGRGYLVGCGVTLVGKGYYSRYVPVVHLLVLLIAIKTQHGCQCVPDFHSIQLV